MIIPMPRMQMYGGDWILWFAELEPKPGLAPQIRAPLPIRKFQQVSERSDLHMSGLVQFSALLLKSGRLASVDLMRQSGPAANQGAIADLQSWQFLPALRDGEAVDVEIILEIPYR